MKGLSIEEKAKAYDEALAKAIKIHRNYKGRVRAVDVVIEEVFPKVQESEDEKSKKWILEYLYDGLRKSDEQFKDHFKAAIAWIEKQGEQKPAFEMKTPEESLGVDSDTYNKIVDECVYGEQKPTDETKLKIEEGKWYVCISQFCDCVEGRAYKAISDSRIIDDFGAEYDMHSDAYKYFRLWTIQDAKDGNILVCGKEKRPFIFKGLLDKFHPDNPVAYCGIDCCNEFCITVGINWWTDEEVEPATKEQHDTLFTKIKEAGYEWDAEKKELKKIEQIQVIDYPDNLPKDNWELVHEFVNKFGRIPKDEDELNALVEYVLKRQKPAWTPMDEQHVENLLAIIEGHGYPGEVTWLNSLKDRVQPKQKNPVWSEEDDKILKSIIINIKNLQFSEDMREKYHHIPNANKSYYQIRIDWLKSIKERIVPQQKQEWSEEDNAILEKCIGAVKVSCYSYSFKSEAENWLKSLRPQNRWKPSLSQLNALGIVAKGNPPDDIEEIKSLYNDLHKLTN